MLSRPLLWAAIVTMVSVAVMFALLRKHALTPARLSLIGLLYIAFATGLALIKPFADESTDQGSRAAAVGQDCPPRTFSSHERRECEQSWR